ncbi:4-carboxymuconolactone decarboxylase [Myceligenerans pegani]|uniref:4-carboxymuconolactone decarboxylase n=1 Tax=Myceligenerans pegani TaxID=2776917 RepID=A0ABR9N5T0_9MICO|nr:4-carboxymuconolactone decarboxylase [Myceligenerans sp. TRM 65318]MBE3021285.1 4-carboxymuconolactone decarboxylase [Myceligenerans sp. TRM 65318]
MSDQPTPPPVLGAVRFALRDTARPLIVLGPSLGTSVEALWRDAAELLAPDLDVIGWDLPGHGASPALDGPATCEGLTVADLAAGVHRLVMAAQAERGDTGAPYWYAGVSVGGAVGLQLLLDMPDVVRGAVLLATGARIGDPERWHERADLVATAGTPTQVTGSAERWFAPGFVGAEPHVTTRLLAALQTTDRFGYAAVCRALARFDVRDRLGEIGAPVVAVAGGHDMVTPVASLEEIAAGVRHAGLRVLDDVAHLPPAEAPAAVAAVIRETVRGGDHGNALPRTDTARRDADRGRGMAVRRAVLGDPHVDRAVAGTTPFTAGFQDLITRYAWGEIWTRPGLDRRMRSAVTLTALVAGGHWDELGMHVRAATRNGLTVDEIQEILLQTAIYCSVPSANHAFTVAQAVLREDGLL